MALHRHPRTGADIAPLHTLREVATRPSTVLAAFVLMLLLQLVAAAVRNTYVITLHSHEFSNQAVGLVSSLDSVGCLFAKLIFAWTLIRLGFRKMTVVALVSLGVLLPLFPLVDGNYGIFPVAFLIGGVTSMLFDGANLAVSKGTRPEYRGSTLALLGAFGGIGSIFGLLDVKVFGTAGETPFLVMLGLLLLCLVVSPWMTLPPEPILDSTQRHRVRLGADAGVLVVSLMAGMVMAGFQSAQLLYAQEGLGVANSEALNLATTAGVGRVVLPVLLGFAGDRWGFRKAIFWTALISAAMLLLLLVVGRQEWVTTVVFFVSGGAGWAIYILGLAGITQSNEGRSMARSIAIYGFSGRAGCIISPVLVGAAMDRFGSNAFLWILAAGFLLTGALGLRVFSSKEPKVAA